MTRGIVPYQYQVSLPNALSPPYILAADDVCRQQSMGIGFFMTIVFALLTAIAFGFEPYFVRKGLIETPSPMMPAFISVTINFSFFVILSFIFVPVGFLKLNLIYLFIIAGILAPGVARFLSYKGIETLGMTISTPILNSWSLFSVMMALIFLNETINFLAGTGVLGVITGLVLLGYETGKKKKGIMSSKYQYRYLFYPVTASIFFGISTFIRKLGLNTLSSPILGATITSGTSWCILAIFLTRSGNVKRLSQIKRQSFTYFVMAGGATCIAWLSFFYALNTGRVVYVAPIVSTYSLLTLFLGYLLLRDMERINLRIVIATILIIGGIILLSIVK
jgi:uncharacterized membrane protein